MTSLNVVISWKFSIPVGCDCNVAGTESCDLDTKKCTCRYNVTGDKCDQCTNGETFPDCVHTCTFFIKKKQNYYK